MKLALNRMSLMLESHPRIKHSSQYQASVTSVSSEYHTSITPVSHETSGTHHFGNSRSCLKNQILIWQIQSSMLLFSRIIMKFCHIQTWCNFKVYFISFRVLCRYFVLNIDSLIFQMYLASPSQTKQGRLDHLRFPLEWVCLLAYNLSNGCISNTQIHVQLCRVSHWWILFAFIPSWWILMNKVQINHLNYSLIS